MKPVVLIRDRQPGGKFLKKRPKSLENTVLTGNNKAAGNNGYSGHTSLFLI